MKKNLLLITSIALLASIASCDKEQIVEKEVGKPAIEFKDLTNNTLVLQAGSTEEVLIGIKTDFDIADLVIEPKDKTTADWCIAQFDGKDAIKITPMDNGLLEEKTTVFVVKAAATKSVTEKIVYVPENVEFTVTRGADQAKILELSAEGLVAEDMGGMIMYSLNIPAEGGDFSIKIQTNGCKWYFTETMQEWWYTFEPASGDNGQNVVFTAYPNQMPQENASTFIVKTDPDSFEGTYITIKQAAKVAVPASAVSVSWNGVKQNSGQTIELSADGGRDKAFKLAIEVTSPAEGEVDFLFCKPGSMTVDPNAENIANLGMCFEEGLTHQIIPVKNTTNSERKIDLVIVGAGTQNELFRIKFNQQA